MISVRWKWVTSWLLLAASFGFSREIPFFVSGDDFGANIKVVAELTGNFSLASSDGSGGVAEKHSCRVGSETIWDGPDPEYVGPDEWVASGFPIGFEEEVMPLSQDGNEMGDDIFFSSV